MRSRAGTICGGAFAPDPPLLRILPSRAFARRAADLRRSSPGAGAGHSHGRRCSQRETDEEAAQAQACGRADNRDFLFDLQLPGTGLRGISFGNFLIKQVVEELQGGVSATESLLSTLSPVPGFRRWADAAGSKRSRRPRCWANSKRDGWWHDLAQSEKLHPALMRLWRAVFDAGAVAGKAASTRWRAFHPRQRRGGWSGSNWLGKHRARAPCGSPSASWSTISTTMTASRIITRSSCATGPSCVRRRSTR